MDTTGLTKRRIDTDDVYRIRHRPRHLPVAPQETQEIEAREVQPMLDKDIIEPRSHAAVMMILQC